MKEKLQFKNPYLLFFPFLIVYIGLVLYFPTNGNFGDEPYYLLYANNILHGFYSPPPPDVDLTYGPGYPLLLALFLAFGLPLIAITLFNAVLYYLSVVLLFKSLRQIVSNEIALCASLFWACYYHCYEQVFLIYTETITSFLVTVIAYLLIKVYYVEKFRRIGLYVLLTGMSIGYIALTKILFGYVLLFMLIGVIVLYLVNRNSYNFQKGAIIMVIAFVTTLPYLFYTYNLTGKIFYWGSSGGNNLYWMSSLPSREYGDWHRYTNFEIDSCRYEPFAIPGREDSIKANHREDHIELFKYKGIERDDLYKKMAIRNIIINPNKFAINCLSNVGRFFFNMPRSYALQRPINLLRIPLNGTLLFLMTFSLLLTVMNWNRIDYPVQFLIVFELLYMGGSILGSTEPRMFSVIVPLVLIWISVVLYRSIQIKWRFENADRNT